MTLVYFLGDGMRDSQNAFLKPILTAFCPVQPYILRIHIKHGY